MREDITVDITVKDCPFAVPFEKPVDWPSRLRLGYFFARRFGTITSAECIITHKECFLERLERKVVTCPIIKRLKRAFESKTYRVIHHLWLKVPSAEHTKWESLVYELTGKSWKYSWQESLGRFLMEQCRQESTCPFKALLPEYKA